MNVRVLILASLYDLGTDEIAHSLARMRVPFVRLNREQLSEHHISLDPLIPRLTIRGPTGTHEICEDLRSILFRQPAFLRNIPARALTVSEQLERSQWQGFLRGLSVFDSVAWMNNPAATYLAESKPYQLARAERCGFRVPDTLISNDAGRIQELFPNRAAIKSVDTVLIHEGTDTLFTFTTTPTTGELSDDSVKAAPVIAQQVLEHKTDLRVTVIGDDLFAVKILSNGAGIEGDWRTQPEASLRYVDTELPADVGASCRKLTRELGLSFGAIDLVEAPDGTFFIEINPTGEWAWLSCPSRPIGHAIAAWLAGSSIRG